MKGEQFILGRRVRVFLNPRSGTADGIAERVRTGFASLGCECLVTALRKGLDLATVLQPNEIAVAAGGDGTVNTVVNAVMRTGNVMGVLPAGTLNHFARDLGIPLELDQAIHAIATGETGPADAAEVNGIFFVNNSSLGAYPAMVLDRERQKRSGRNKWISLAWASVRAFVRFRCLEVELMVDGEVEQHTTPFVFVGNNEYSMEGTELGTRKRLDGGCLLLALAPGATRFGILRLATAALFGRLQVMPEFQHFCVEHFTVNVSKRRRVRVSLDGEVRRLRGPLHYRVCPGALKVIGRASGAVCETPRAHLRRPFWTRRP